MKKVYELLKRYYIFSFVILMMGTAAGAYAQPTADAGPDATICENQTYELSDATASDYDELAWTTSGDGTFSDETALNPIYYPGPSDGNSVDLTLTASAAGFTDAVSTMTLTLAQFPEPYAGEDATICGGNDYDIADASITGPYNFFSWNAGFDGTFDPDPFVIDPTYIPGELDILNGEVTINLVVQPTSPCVAIQSDSFVLTFSDEIDADAGADAEICADETYQLNGSTTNATSSLWTTAGDGSFDDPAALDATYTPGSSDVNNGSVVLTLTANNQYCDPDSDDMLLTINPLPVVECPDDMEVCIDDASFTLTGATPAGGTYSGNGVSGGSFDPASAGVGPHTITYTYMDPVTGCEDDCTFGITVNPLPTVMCPDPFSVCEDSGPVTLTGAMPQGGSYSGTGVSGGSFDPSVGVGTYTITYTYTDPSTGCTNSCDFDIEVAPLPTVDAGDPQTICEDETVFLDATISDECSILWTSIDGDGDFNDATLEDPQYTLAFTEIQNGFVTLRVLAGACDPCTAGQQDEVVITIQRAPVANAGSDVTICEDDTYTLQGSVSHTCGHQWANTTGSGGFDDAGSLNAVFTPAADDLALGFAVLELTAQACSPCSVADDDAVTISFQQNASVDIAVDDATICEDGSYDLDATTSNTSSLLWTTTGGGSFSDPNAEDPTYTPVPSDAPSVTLTLTGQPISPCDTEASDFMTLNIQVLPTVDAGSDATICENGSYTFNDASASDHNGLMWSGGTGSFDNGDQLDATYNAGAGETGNVELTLTAAPIDPCTTSVDDFMTLTINPLPELTDVTLQSTDDSGQSYDPLSGDLANGFGMCLDGDMNTEYWLDVDALTATESLEIDFMNPFYHTATVPADFFTYWAALGVDAGASGGWEEIMWDIINGDAPIFYLVYDGSDYMLIDGLKYQFATAEVPLIIPGNYPQGDYDYTGTIKDVNGCVSEVITVGITFGHEVTADAGEDQTICEGDNVQLDATVENGCAIQWGAVGGSGGFSDENIEDPIYTPSTLDIIAGSVTLAINASACDPCTESASDQITIYFADPPTAEAGDDATICEDDSYELYGSVSNACGNTWSTAGDGGFDDAGSLTATYTPGPNDISNGSVQLTLTADACDPCTDVATDDMTLYFQDAPTVDILVDNIDACELDEIHFDNTLVEYSDKSSVIWFTGNGSNNWDDNEADYPTYTLSQTDAAQGVINITVTVVGVDPCTTSFAEDNCTITVQLLPIVDAGENKTVCENGSVDLDDATAQQYSSLLWTSTYPDGSFSDATALNPSYSPGPTAVAAGETFLTLTAQPIDPCTTEQSSSLMVYIQDLPEVDAGEDATICEDGNYTLDGTVDIACGTPSYMWSTTDGTGTFDDVNSLTANYTPSAADILAGSVTLTLTGYPCTPCVDNVSDDMILTFQPLPTVDAGADADVCESGFYLLEATASNQSAVSWSTDGDGTFDDNLLLNPTYYPGTNDAASGTVTLEVTAFAIGPCTESVSDEITLSVQPLPIADAGADDTACETGYTFQSGSVSVENNSNLEWTTNGDGTFDDAMTLLTTYYPGSGDVGAGIVTLTLVANPINPCVISDQDDMNLTILESATVDAGDDATICDTDSYELLDATAENYTSVTWTTSGDGNFSNPNAVNPTYTPGGDDIAAGTVELCLEAESIDPCTAIPQDCMILTIQGSPTADAGTDGSMCETGGSISGSATNYAYVEWTTAGDGGFDDAAALSTNYTPGVDDITAGSVTLTLTAYPIDPCTLEASDDVTYYFTLLPVADAGADVTICETGTYELDGSAENACGTLWSSGGDGSFDDATSLTATYTPGPNDLAAGMVSLTLTAEACAPCDQDDTDDVIIYFQVAPESYAGEDGTFCEDAIFLNDATVANNVSILWTTSGDGTFSDPAILTPQYFPGDDDKADGQVTLTITATPILPCDVAAKDDIVVTIELNPVVADLDDATICEDDTYTIPVTPTAENYSSIEWSTSGTGTFDDDTAENPTYTPSQDDIDAGSVELCLDVYPNNPCVLELQECMTLTIQKLPTVFAGDDDTSCGIDPYQLVDATAENYQPGSILWSSSGDGTFSDPTDINPTYYPGPDDKANLSVTLQVQVSPIAPCSVPPVTDQLVIFIQLNPTVDAGVDGTACEDGSFALDATAANYSTLEWTTLGGGTFDDATMEDATYYPVPGDAPEVTLTLTAQPIDPCTTPVSDDVLVAIQVLPTVDAGSNATICENGSYTFDDASASDYSTLLWTGGTGSFDNADQLDATYNAGAGETGDVQLTLTAEPIDPCTTSVDDFMTLTIDPLPELTDLTLQSTLAVLPPDFTALSGDLANGFGMCLDGDENTHYWLDVDALTATESLETGFFNEFYHTATVPGDFFTYWADRGVVSGATGWQGIMWDIINGDLPVFYLVYDGADYVLIDGLQYQNVPSEELPLTIPGDYPQGLYDFTGTIKDVNGCVSDDITVGITFGHAPVADAGPDAEICEDGSYVLSGATVENESGQMWSTSGDGTFDDPTALNAEYTPGTLDAESGSVELCLVAEPTEPCFVDSDPDCMTLTIQRQPTVFAGDDDTTCGLEPFTLSDATAEDYQAVLWTTSGDGSFDDDESVNPTYYPGVTDQSNQSVTLTISASPIAPCVGPSIEDQIVIFIQLSPSADAGSDATICADGTHELADASVENASGQYWTTAGDGNFDDSDALNPIYTPGSDDIANGSVELCLTAEPVSPCTVESTPDCMTLTIQPLPIADAGDDGVVCENDSYQISGASVTNATGQMWSTTGDGSFSSTNDLNPIYYPGADDVTNGTVELCLVALPTSPCVNNSAPDCMTLDIQYLPIADAGGDATTCANEPYQLNGSVQYSTSYTWSTSGGGTFDDQTSLTATYYPSEDDLNDGNVTLTLTAGAEAPCTGGDVSNMLLNFTPEPFVIFANEDGQFYQDATLTYCFDETVTITLDEIVDGVAPFDFEWDIYESGSLVDNGSATGVELDDELFSNTYPAGEYTVELTSMVDDNGCSPTDISVYTVNIVVNPQPNPFFTIDDDPLLPGGIFDYCYDVTEIMLALVEEQGGQNSVGTPPFDISISINGGTDIDFNGVNFGDEIDLLTYTSGPGTYDVQVTSLVDANGCAIPTTVLNNYYYFTVNIHEEPALIFAANGTQFYEGATLEYCEGETVTISLDEVLSGEGPFDIAWTVDGTPDDATGINLGDNLFSGQLAAGTYPIQITSIVDANGCEPSDYAPYNATVVVSPPPAVIFAANGQQFYEGDVLEFCEGDNIEVTLDEIVLGTAPFSISWTVNGTPDSQTGVNPGDALFSGTQPVGTYDIEITNITDANGCSPLDVSMYYATFIVNPQPALIFAANGDQFYEGDVMEYCEGDNIELTLDEIVTGTAPFDIAWTVNGTPDSQTGVDVGDVLFSGTQPAGTYDLAITSITDANGCSALDVSMYNATIIVNPQPALIFAATDYGQFYEGAELVYCEGDNIEITLDEIVTGTAPFDIAWTVNGTPDSQTGVNVGDALFSGTQPAGSYDLVITSIMDANGCLALDVSMYYATITVNPQPALLFAANGTQFFGGETLEFCETDNIEITLDEIVTGTAPFDIAWTVNGTPDNQTGVNVGDALFSGTQPVDSYDIEITSITDANGCSALDVSMYNVTIDVIALPTVDAGENATICEGEDFPLSDATAENYSTVLWSSNGTGDFDDPTAVNPVYTPGAGDAGNTVTLFLVAQPNAPCANIASDFVTLFIQPAPYAYAGEDASICEGDIYPLADADAMNFETTMWDSDGLGSFDDATLINATYTPDAGDVGNTVTLCLTAEAVDPCEVAAEDCIELFIQPAPTAFSGNDATIQSDETYTLSEATATNYSDLLWETSGDGTFDDNGVLQPTYTPGIQDMIDGEVLLTLTAIGIDPCGNAMHNMVLTIEGVPPTVEITSPVDGTFFNYSPITVEGTASDLDGFVDFVEVRVNGGPWQLATGTDNWTIEVQLDPCLNTIEARATDTQGLQSDIDIVTEIKLNGQLIEMVQGWSYISSYIEATDPDFYTLEDYLVPQNNLVIMLNEDGQIFWPSEEVNTLVEWDTQFGYKAKSNENGTWLLAGENTANQTITLDPGPNIFPVLTNVDYPLPGDFNDEDILIIFELQTARIYWPDGGLYTLTELKPGFGYLGNFYNQFSITYPDYVDCELKSGTNDVEYVTNESPWELERTASVHFISITNEAVSELDDAEFIGAFDANGICIGYADVREKADNYLLTVYGDESVTDWKDGAVVGEAINLVAYNGVEEQVVAKYDMSMPNFDGRFANSGMSKITSFKEASTGIGNVAVNGMIRIFPNPATDQVNIYYPVSDGFNNAVKVTFATASGSVVITQDLTTEESQVDISNLQPGVYFVKFESNGNTAVKRLVIK